MYLDFFGAYMEFYFLIRNSFICLSLKGMVYRGAWLFQARFGQAYIYRVLSAVRVTKIERKHCRRVYFEAYTDIVANVYDKEYTT